jgi:hypothetical protein
VGSLTLADPPIDEEKLFRQPGPPLVHRDKTHGNSIAITVSIEVQPQTLKFVCVVFSGRLTAPNTLGASKYERVEETRSDPGSGCR